MAAHLVTVAIWQGSCTIEPCGVRDQGLGITLTGRPDHLRAGGPTTVHRKVVVIHSEGAVPDEMSKIRVVRLGIEP